MAKEQNETQAQDEQPADPTAQALDDLAAQSSANNTPPPQPEPKRAPDNLDADLLGVLRMAQAAARPRMWWLTPAEFEQQWGDNTLQAIAEPGAEIMRRNGWTMADAFSKYGPYLALAGALLPPVMVTVQAYKMAQVTPRAQPVSADAGGPTHD